MRIHPENAELSQLCLRWCIGIANVSSEIKPVPLPRSPAFLYLGSFVSELDQASLSFQIPVSSVKTFTGYVLDSSGVLTQLVCYGAQGQGTRVTVLSGLAFISVLHDLVDGALNWKSRVRGLWKIFAADTEVRIGKEWLSGFQGLVL
ncbi:hypothetical protein JEQ12_017622 [Ovis aries]|uniref:Uncharacterized protein n=1 Tax=Ovis aries TaxID=9940 RepID=A0A836D2F5_SHEEP|nr:hypothetical protein JEQ12_017622 [Ovis aries]